MTALPVLPDSGTLVLITGTQPGQGVTLESVDALRQWRPTIPIRRVQIFDSRRPVQPQAHYTWRRDGTHVYDLEGVLSIEADGHLLEGSAPVEAALAAYDWAYGLTPQGQSAPRC